MSAVQTWRIKALVCLYVSAGGFIVTLINLYNPAEAASMLLQQPALLLLWDHNVCLGTSLLCFSTGFRRVLCVWVLRRPIEGWFNVILLAQRKVHASISKVIMKIRWIWNWYWAPLNSLWHLLLFSVSIAVVEDVCTCRNS